MAFEFQARSTAAATSAAAATAIRTETRATTARATATKGIATKGYGNRGYAGVYGDLTFRCNVDYRGAVTNLRVRRNDNFRRPY